MKITKAQMITFLVDTMGYDEDQLEGMSLSDMKDGLNMGLVEAYIS